jgi:hypothetical protein
VAVDLARRREQEQMERSPGQIQYLRDERLTMGDRYPSRPSDAIFDWSKLSLLLLLLLLRSLVKEFVGLGLESFQATIGSP